MALAPGAVLELDVTDPVAGGRMLARHAGEVVLVSGAIPGERVRAIVEPSPKRVRFARTVDVIDASPDRRPAASDPACGGMLYAHIEPARQRTLKALVIADAFRRIAKAPLEHPPVVATSPEHGYRLRARLHVRRGQAGFFREHTHDICDAGATGQLRPAALDAVAAILAALGPEAAACESVVVAENVRGDERVVHLVPQPGARLDRVAATVGETTGVTGLTAGGRGAPTHVAGVPFLEDTAADLSLDAGSEVRWRRQAASFFQANRHLVGALTAAVLREAVGERIADLYAGVGLFSLPLAARGAAVLAVEGDDTSAADLQHNAAVWPHLDVAHAAVEAVLRDTPSIPPATVIVDPPRTGLSPDALGALIRWDARRIVYVSCDPPTLARDARSLFAAGYALAHVEAFDFFPNTAHVETLAVFAIDSEARSPA